MVALDKNVEFLGEQSARDTGYDVVLFNAKHSLTPSAEKRVKRLWV
jgi:hypothetical protein